MRQGTRFSRLWVRAIVLAAALAIPTAAAAQTTITSSDIQRLQDDVYQAGADVTRLRTSDPDTAARLQADLDDLREEVIYLKVRLRKEGRVPRAEYTDVRDRIAALRERARPAPTSSSTEREGSWRPSSAPSSDIPVGQEIDVRLQTELSSATAQVEDRFEATTLVDLYRGDAILIPAGSVLRGVVRTVDKATRTDRKGQLTLSFDQITVRGRTYPMRGTVAQALESSGIKGEAGRIAVGSAIGGVIGGIIGGVKGGLLGVLIGGGGTIIATEGKDVTLPAGTVLRVRLDTPPEIR